MRTRRGDKCFITYPFGLLAGYTCTNPVCLLQRVPESWPLPVLHLTEPLQGPTPEVAHDAARMVVGSYSGVTLPAPSPVGATSGIGARSRAGSPAYCPAARGPRTGGTAQTRPFTYDAQGDEQACGRYGPHNSPNASPAEHMAEIRMEPIRRQSVHQCTAEGHLRVGFGGDLLR